MKEIMIDGHKFQINTIQSVQYLPFTMNLSDTIILGYNSVYFYPPKLLVNFGNPIICKQDIKSPIDLLQISMEKDISDSNKEIKSKKSQSIRGNEIGISIISLLNCGYYSRQEAIIMLEKFETDIEAFRSNVLDFERQGFVLSDYLNPTELLLRSDFKLTNEKTVVQEAREYFAEKFARNQPEFVVDFNKYRK